MIAKLMGRLQGSPRMRAAVIMGIGLSAFVLGATYLSLQDPPDVPTFLLVGSDKVAAGTTAAFRVRARTLDAGASVDVTVPEVGFAGPGEERFTPLAIDVDPGDPATVLVTLPPQPPGSHRATLRFFARADERVVALDVPVEVLTAEAEFSPHPRPPPTLHPTERPLRLALVTEGAGLVSRLDNRLWVRIRDAAGEAVRGATVHVNHSTLPDGRLTLTTDAFGLASFNLEATRPSYMLRFQVSAGELEASFEELVIPAGRQLLLRPARHVIAPGDSLALRVVTWRRGEPLFCELRRGPVWLWSQRLDAQSDLTFTVGPLEAPGRYDVQCYFHPHTPGTAWATTPILVGEGSPLALLRAQVDTYALLPEGALGDDPTGPAGELGPYLAAMLNAAPVPPAHLVNTRASDLASRDAAWDDRKRVVLFALGGVFLLVILVTFDLILGNILATRDRMRAYLSEMAEEDAHTDHPAEAPDESAEDMLPWAHKDRDGIVRTRGVLMILLVGGTLVVNVAAFIALMSLIR